jgi:hypothetical protein
MVEAPGEDRCAELLERLVAVATAELSPTA